MADLTNPTRPKPRIPAPSQVPEWEPSRNAIHRLIQMMDVMAIAFNKYRQLSFGIPRHGTPAYSPEARTEMLNRILADYHAVSMSVFPHADYAPKQTAQRLADGATAAAVRTGIADPRGDINSAAIWLTRIGWITTPKTSECYGDLWTREFDEEQGRLTEYMVCRQQLLTMLSRAGHDLPTTIHQRFAVAFRTILTSDVPPLSVAELQLMVAEATREESSEVACRGRTEFVADVTLGELEVRLIEWEQAKVAPRSTEVRVVSPAEFKTRAYASALTSQRVAELQAAAECAQGFSELHTLSIRLFRDDLNAGTCKMFRHALVASGMSVSEAREATIPEVLAQLRLLQEGVSQNEARCGEQKSVASSAGNAEQVKKSKGKRGRKKAKDADPDRYKKDLKFYQDWQVSTLTQPAFVRERGVDLNEGMKSLGRGKHYAKKSGNNSVA